MPENEPENILKFTFAVSTFSFLLSSFAASARGAFALNSRPFPCLDPKPSAFRLFRSFRQKFFPRQRVAPPSQFFYFP
jgi:hypothetical protein